LKLDNYEFSNNLASVFDGNTYKVLTNRLCLSQNHLSVYSSVFLYFSVCLYSVCPAICLSLRLSACQFIFLSSFISRSVYLSVFLYFYICMSVHQSVFIYLSLCLSVHQFFYFSIPLSVHLFIHSSVRPFICLSVCLFVIRSQSEEHSQEVNKVYVYINSFNYTPLNRQTYQNVPFI